MGCQVGTGALSDGVYGSQQQGLVSYATDERDNPRFDWQRRSPRTRKDLNQWASLWPRGWSNGGVDTADYYAVGSDDSYEPFSCDGEGTSISKFLRGTCLDASDVPIANPIVQGFRTSDDAFVGQVTAGADGTYVLPTDNPAGTAHYVVAYKAGSPDLAGTTVNTLTPTNVDGS